MTPLNLPAYDARTTGTADAPTIFDVLRGKYVALTPEEWVRQHFVHFLTEHKGYPRALMANEVQLRMGDKLMRADGVLYDRQLRPRMIMEYKAPSVSITRKTFQQIAAYNLLLHVDYLVVSNGVAHYCLRRDPERGSYTFLKDIPDYDAL